MRTLSTAELATIAGNGYQPPSYEPPKGGYEPPKAGYGEKKS